MEVKELRAFVQLAEYMHFGRTAKLLNLTQPALTKQIHKLEALLGTPLFEREGKSIRLTAFGQQFLPKAQSFIAYHEQLCIFAQKLLAGEQGFLRIGFSHFALDVVPRLIVQYRKNFPGVALSLKDLSTYEQVEALRDRQLDIGFVKLSAATDTEFETLPVVQEQLMLVTPAQSHLTGVTHLSACTEVPFVIISKARSPVLHHQILRLCNTYGFHPQIVQEVEEVASILALVKAGLGISVLPPSFCSPDLSGLHFYPQSGAEAIWSVFAAWRKDDANAALNAFIALLQAEVGA